MAALCEGADFGTVRVVVGVGSRAVSSYLVGRPSGLDPQVFTFTLALHTRFIMSVQNGGR